MDHLGHRDRLIAAPLIAGRQRGPHRLAAIDPRDLCPETGRARLVYDGARILLGQYADGLELHQLRHSSHLGDANTSTNLIMTKTRHKSPRSVQRYMQPGLADAHTATETLSDPRTRG